MFANLILAAAFQVGPFYQQTPQCDDFTALRPLWSQQGETTDVLWPVFTKHRDWWRFCWFVHDQWSETDAYQFEVIPFWFNGRTRAGEDYWGLFPIWGHHPHVLLVYDFDFCLWPLWMRYRMPRPSTGEWLETQAVLFPFVHWRSDGSWGFWPFYEKNLQRESVHETALWPIVTWADYRDDRDTGGKGSSWMVWPFYGRVRREREKQDLVLPPLVSVARTYPTYANAGETNSWETLRVRAPWPIVEFEWNTSRTRRVIFPLWEDISDRRFVDGEGEGGVTRFGWRLVELYWGEQDELVESRVFPFWVKSRDYFRLWPFYEGFAADRGSETRVHSAFQLFPIRWAEGVWRNWSAFWTFYRALEHRYVTRHSLFWGLIRWNTFSDD